MSIAVEAAITELQTEDYPLSVNDVGVLVSNTGKHLLAMQGNGKLMQHLVDILNGLGLNNR